MCHESIVIHVARTLNSASFIKACLCVACTYVRSAGWAVKYTHSYRGREVCEATSDKLDGSISKVHAVSPQREEETVNYECDFPFSISY